MLKLRYIHFTITATNFTEIGFGPKGHSAVKLAITDPDMTEAQVQGILSDVW